MFYKCVPPHLSSYLSRLTHSNQFKPIQTNSHQSRTTELEMTHTWTKRSKVMRSIIKHDINRFRQQRKVMNMMVCDYCFDGYNLQVHHEHVSFSALKRKFEHRYAPRHSRWRPAWQRFHANNAQLSLVCAACHDCVHKNPLCHKMSSNNKSNKEKDVEPLSTLDSVYEMLKSLNKNR